MKTATPATRARQHRLGTLRQRRRPGAIGAGIPGITSAHFLTESRLAL